MDNLDSRVRDILQSKIQKNALDAPRDYFNWGRDSRHIVDDTEQLPETPSSAQILSKIARELYGFLIGTTKSQKLILHRYKKIFSTFDETYQLMSDDYSRRLFAELILMKIMHEKNMRLSTFTPDFVDSYEKASEVILNSDETLRAYRWILRKVTLDDPAISFYTVPTLLNLHYSGRLYRYHKDDVLIEVEGGDIVIDAGVGWGDTTIYLAACAGSKPGGHLYAFDILEEGMKALSEQCRINPGIRNLTPVLRAVSDKDGESVYISSPDPGARVVDDKTARRAETISIDTFYEQNGLEKVDFIKMDIEGSEVPALTGAAKTIKSFKPRLAISAYHKWDDLLVIPRLINSIRDDYNFYLDCTTGFGGETILFAN